MNDVHQMQEDFVIHSCSLTWELLEKNPVWTETDDDAELIRPDVSNRPFASDFLTLTLRAHFTTVNGCELKGSVVYGSAFERVYLIEIFASSEAITFNRNLSSLVPQQLQRLQDAIGTNADQVFPISFQTGVIGKDGELFSGQFDPRQL